MPKTLNTYRTYTTSAIKYRTDIPDVSSDIIEVDSSTIYCYNIKMSAVKNLLGSSTYSLKDLCTHSAINHWSGFGPTLYDYVNDGTLDASLICYDPSTIFSLGSFSGYNHSAPTPGWNTGGKAAAGADVWINSGEKAEFVSSVIIGEVNYPSALGVTLIAIDDTSTIQAYGQTNINEIGNTVSLTAESIDTITLAKTWTLKSYIANSYTAESAGDVLDSLLCRVPNVDDVSVNVKIKVASEWHYDGDAQTAPDPWVQTGAEGMNWTTGIFDIGNLIANENYTNIKIFGRLFNASYTQVGNDGVIYDDAYTAMSDIIGDTSFGVSVPIDSYGYHVVIYIEYNM